MRFGVWLPSFAYPDRDPSRMARLRRYVLELVIKPTHRAGSHV